MNRCYYCSPSAILDDSGQVGYIANSIEGLGEYKREKLQPLTQYVKVKFGQEGDPKASRHRCCLHRVREVREVWDREHIGTMDVGEVFRQAI